LSEEHGSYLALFNGVMTGEVRNPVTGRLYQRREIMEFYRTLLFTACKKPVNERTIDMLEMVRSFLEVPSDLHLALLIEARDSRADPPQPGPSEPIRRDMDATFDRWMAQHITHQEMVRDLFREFKDGSLEVERSSLLNSDYQVIGSHRRAPPPEDVTIPSGPGKYEGKELKVFQERFLKP
jgi:hypothetical protein